MPNPSPSLSRFSERKTEEYEDSEDALYRSFGDAEGSLHWGALEASQDPACGAPDSTSTVRGDFLAAGLRSNAVMLENSGGDTGRNERFATPLDAYRSMVKAIQNEELGWAQHLRVE